MHSWLADELVVSLEGPLHEIVMQSVFFPPFEGGGEAWGKWVIFNIEAVGLVLDALNEHIVLSFTSV